jgi:inner membrane protein involved in colicin E2 resistance
MERGLALKLIAMVVLAAFLMLALSSIRGLVAERQARRDAAVEDMARSSSGEQQLATPAGEQPARTGA